MISNRRRPSFSDRAYSQSAMRGLLYIGFGLVCTTMAGLAMAGTTIPDPDRAQLLYETHCIGCHTSAAHRGSDRRARSEADVSIQVRRWSDNQKLGWTDEDVDQVTALLVRRYYHFAPSADGAE